MFVPWFSTYHWEAMAGLTVSPGKGLFWYGPPLIGVVLVASSLIRRQPAAFAALMAYTTVTLLVVGRMTFWAGDWNWGPRYMAWWVWEEAERRGSRARIAGAVALFLAVALQTLPIVGRGNGTYLRETVWPLWRSGALVTSHMKWGPGPADNHVLYFRFENSPIVTLARSLPAQFSDPEKSSQRVGGLVLTLPNGWQRIIWLVLTLLAGVLGLAFVRFTHRKFAEDASARAAATD